MASSASVSVSGRGGGFLLPAAVLLVVAVVHARGAPAAPCVPRVFSFGDSLADTGNFPFLYGNDSREPALRTPYGETFFRRATGRFSDGRLIVDFIGKPSTTTPPPSIARPASRARAVLIEF
ncbi:hypothetical protein ACQJBY_022791 [Aegilops geniculata]